MWCGEWDWDKEEYGSFEEILCLTVSNKINTNYGSEWLR